MAVNKYGGSVPQSAIGPNLSVDMNSLQAGIADRVTGHYYYRLKLAAGTTLQPSYSLFNAYIGQQDPYPLSTVTVAPTLSKVDTNIISPAGLGFSAPWDIIVDSIGCYIDPTTIKVDLDQFRQYGYFELSILQKVQWDGKFEFYPAGAGVSGFSTQTNESGWQLGTASPRDRKRFGRFGKYIPPQTNWSFTLFFPSTSGPVSGNAPVAVTLATSSATPTPGVGVMFTAVLLGLLDRPVT